MPETDHNHTELIILPESCFLDMTRHCRRKLAGDYLTGEDRNLKAFGLLAGERDSDRLIINACFPLLQNVRSVSPHREYMDLMMKKHAVPSETPLDQRGWVAAPDEIRQVLAITRAQGSRLLGTYHMHRVAWEHDPVRDTPTTLDKVLGHGSRLVMFIISMVEPDQPRLRAFMEGDINREIPVSFSGG